MCDHIYKYIETIKSSDSSGYNIMYKKVDRFYCEKCLHQTEKIKKEYSREKPEWY